MYCGALGHVTSHYRPFSYSVYIRPPTLLEVLDYYYVYVRRISLATTCLLMFLMSLISYYDFVTLSVTPKFPLLLTASIRVVTGQQIEVSLSVLCGHEDVDDRICAGAQVDQNVAQ